METYGATYESSSYYYTGGETGSAVTNPSGRSSISSQSQKSEITNKERVKSNLNYCGCIIRDVHLAQSLQEFKNQFIEQFSLEDQITEGDEITIHYDKSNNEGALQDKIYIENDTDYQNMLKDFFQDKKEKTIYIDTKKLPVYFTGDKTYEFEDEIKNVVQREFKIAGNNIKKCLTTHVSVGNCKQVRNLTCSNCNNQIIGCYYKKLAPSDKDEHFCEMCASEIDYPCFKIY